MASEEVLFRTLIARGATVEEAQRAVASLVAEREDREGKAAEGIITLIPSTWEEYRFC
jgi:hypothetical protein